MSSTTAPETFSDLYTDLLQRAREDTTLTATVEQAKRYINIGLLDMHIGFAEMVPWAERETVLVTHLGYSTGTVQVVRGSSAIAGTGTAWSTANAQLQDNMREGGKLVVSGDLNVYTVGTVVSDTVAALNYATTADSDSGLSYRYYEDEYSLASDFLRPLDYRGFDDQRKIDLIGRREFQRRYPKNDRINRPRVATIIDNVDTTTSDDTPVRRVRFYPAPDKSYAIPYSYVTKNLVVSSSNVAKEAFTADADEPIVPKRARQAIVYKALSQWYRDKKDDVRSQQANAEYVDLVTRVVNDQEIGASRPQLRPRMGTYSRRASAPWGGPGGRYDVNGWFDRMEDR
jgi:hypothetical protein